MIFPVLRGLETRSVRVRPVKANPAIENAHNAIISVPHKISDYTKMKSMEFKN